MTELCLYILPKICWSSIWQGLNRDLACFFLKITCNEGMELPQAGIRQGSVIPSRQRHFMINTVSFKFLCTVIIKKKNYDWKILELRNWTINKKSRKHNKNANGIWRILFGKKTIKQDSLRNQNLKYLTWLMINIKSN